MNIEEKIGDSGVILYDDGCGLCTSFIARKSNLFKHYGFTTYPLQEDWVLKNFNTSEQDLMKDMHIFTKDSKVYKGAEACRQICKKIWWLNPIYYFSTLPGIKILWNKTYRIVADRRQRISKVCGLQRN